MVKHYNKDKMKVSKSNPPESKKYWDYKESKKFLRKNKKAFKKYDPILKKEIFKV